MKGKAKSEALSPSVQLGKVQLSPLYPEVSPSRWGWRGPAPRRGSNATRALWKNVSGVTPFLAKAKHVLLLQVWGPQKDLRRISEGCSLPLPVLPWGLHLCDSFARAPGLPQPRGRAPTHRGRTGAPLPHGAEIFLCIPRPLSGWKQLVKTLGGGSQAAPSEIRRLLSQLAGETRYREVKSPSLLGPGYFALQDVNSEELYLPREEVEPFPFPPSFRKDRTPPGAGRDGAIAEGASGQVRLPRPPRKGQCRAPPVPRGRRGHLWGCGVQMPAEGLLWHYQRALAPVQPVQRELPARSRGRGRRSLRVPRQRGRISTLSDFMKEMSSKRHINVICGGCWAARHGQE